MEPHTSPEAHLHVLGTPLGVLGWGPGISKKCLPSLSPLPHAPRAEFLHKAPVCKEPLAWPALDSSASLQGSQCYTSVTQTDLTHP